MTRSWFTDPEMTSTTYSISHVCNNLSKVDDVTAYVHSDDVVHVNVAQTPCIARKISNNNRAFVRQVRVCKFGEVTIIVIASETGVEIYDDQGEHLLYSLRAKDRLELPEKGATLFCHGICSCNGEKSYVLVGTSVGKIFVMGRETGAKGEFEILETLQGHKEAISAIESTKTGSFVASGDDSGAILIRNPSDEFEILHRLTGEGYPLTSLRFTNDGWLVSGYLTGKIRVFKKHTFQVYADIAAHSRAVTALDVHDNFVVSVGEDTFMNIWEFTGSKSALRVKLVSSQCIPNDLLVGVAFDGMKKIYTAAYDTRHLKLWIPE